MKTFVSDISGKRFPIDERISAEIIRPSVMQVIQEEHPDFMRNNSLSLSELNIYREKYISSYLSQEIGQLSELDKKVLDSINENSILTDRTDDHSKQTLTLGERISDEVALFGGSWAFIILFMCTIIAWIVVNVIILTGKKAFDPYPFILLNLLLSCLAAIQAPIILMSQNRQAAKDREQSKEDYMVNLKAEIEIRTLHEKVDHLMIFQQQKLIEIQKIQIEMLNDIIKQVTQKPKRTAP